MTFLGSHTIPELADLVANYDQQVGQVDAAYHAHENAVDVSWLNDWNALKARYQVARSKASVALTAAKLTPAPSDLLAAEGEYQGVLRALQQNPAQYTDRDFQGLYNRLTQQIGAVPATAVQPTATDVDLRAYQGLDQAAQDMPTWVKTAVATAVPDLVPKTKDQVNYKPLPGWVKWGAIAAVAGVGVVALKVVTR